MSPPTAGRKAVFRGVHQAGFVASADGLAAAYPTKREVRSAGQCSAARRMITRLGARHAAVAARAQAYRVRAMDRPQTAAAGLTTTELLERLVSFDTTSRKSNLALICFVRGYLDGLGVPYRVSTDAAGRESQSARRHRPADSRRAGAQRPCRYRPGRWPGLDRRSVRAAPPGRQAVRARQLRHEGLRRRLPGRGAGFPGAPLGPATAPVHQLRRGSGLRRRAAADPGSRRIRAAARSLCGRRAVRHEADPGAQGQAQPERHGARPDRPFQRAGERRQRGAGRRRGDRLGRARSPPAGRGRPVRGRVRSAAHDHPCRHRRRAARS